MKKLLPILFLIFTLSFSACGYNSKTTDEVTLTSDPTLSPSAPAYTLFIINTHDWVLPDYSIETLNRVIDIHEEYEVPVNIYLTDPMVQAYSDEAPDLIDRLKNSPQVVVSYHTRAPAPYYADFDFLGLHELSDEEIYNKIMEYETHALDLRTGLPTGEEGGYAYLKEILGYAPPSTGVGSVYNNVTTQALNVYKELGATFYVVHGKDIKLGDKKEQTYLRPETIEVKLYEAKKSTDTGTDVLRKAINEYQGTSDPIFLNVKFHEDNFYMEGDRPWLSVFYESSTYKEDKKDNVIKEPPYDIDSASDYVTYKTQEQMDHMWDIYEDAVKYVKNNSSVLQPISEFDLLKMLTN